MNKPALALTIITATLALGFGGVKLAASAAPGVAAACPVAAERFYSTAEPMGDGRTRANHFVLLRNADAQPRGLVLQVSDTAGWERRGTARITLTGGESAAVLLGREVLDAGREPRAPSELARATRLSCRQ